MADAALGPSSRIVIYGAGSIGCFIGGLLAAAGRKIVFLTRPRIAAELAAHGLWLTDFGGLSLRIPPNSLDVATSSNCLASAALILLTVKSGDTAAAADDIAVHAAREVPVLSLQNGVDNVAALSARLGVKRAIGGMVGFNVVHKGQGRFHRGTSGALVIQDGHPDVVSLLTVLGLDVAASRNMAGVQWGKLVINLNNALNALSDLPLKQQLEDRAWRQVLADQIAEAVTILDAAGIKTVPPTKVPIRFLPAILRLPNSLFRLVAKPMLTIDPQARSSMWDDLMQRRRTEVDHLQGAIMRLARRHDLGAPLSERIHTLVREAEATASGPPGLRPEQIRANA